MCPGQEEASSPRVTLRSLQERVLRRLEHWKARRMERMAEYEAVVVSVRCMLWCIAARKTGSVVRTCSP